MDRTPLLLPSFWQHFFFALIFLSFSHLLDLRVQLWGANKGRPKKLVVFGSTYHKGGGGLLPDNNFWSKNTTFWFYLYSIITWKNTIKPFKLCVMLWVINDKLSSWLCLHTQNLAELLEKFPIIRPSRCSRQIIKKQKFFHIVAGGRGVFDVVVCTTQRHIDIKT